MSRLRQERITDVAGVMGAAAGAAIAADLENKRLRAEVERLTIALGDEHARLSAEAEANARNNDALAEANADLRDCRARLAALVDEERTAYSGGVHATAAMDAALQWLTAHPAEGGQE